MTFGIDGMSSLNTFGISWCGWWSDKNVENVIALSHRGLVIGGATKVFKPGTKFSYCYAQTLKFRICSTSMIQHWMRLGIVHKLCNAFFIVFDHPPTHSNVLAVILFKEYHNELCNSNTFTDHPPTPPALRNLWMPPKEGKY